MSWLLIEPHAVNCFLQEFAREQAVLFHCSCEWSCFLVDINAPDPMSSTMSSTSWLLGSYISWALSLTFSSVSASLMFFILSPALRGAPLEKNIPLKRNEKYSSSVNVMSRIMLCLWATELCISHRVAKIHATVFTNIKYYIYIQEKSKLLASLSLNYSHKYGSEILPLKIHCFVWVLFFGGLLVVLC